MTDAYETTICCRALLVTVLVRPNFYSARPQASRQLNPALRQLSEIGGIVNLVDRRRSSISRSERPPCRAKSITRFDDGYDEAKFSKVGVCDKVPEGSARIFGDTRITF